jgi:hypothetical protein
MIKLKTVIRQLTEPDYEGLQAKFQKNRAGKFLSLLQYLRQSDLDDDEIAKKQGLNYTLKSRLYEKIQEYLFENAPDPRIELLRNVSNIYNLTYNTPKAMAIAILKKLEKELTEFDMPNELISVYDAMKKLHISSDKYYDYTQLYNKHVAYTLALDKAGDLLSRFTKSLGAYLVSRDKNQIELLVLMKTEMSNVFRLYESHHLAIYRNILHISFALFVPSKMNPDDESVEQMLTASFKIFDGNPRDAEYPFLRTVLDYLAFEYYHGLKLYKNEAPYFERVNARLDAFLLTNHCCFVTQFLISKVERYIELDTTEQLELETSKMVTVIASEDAPNYVYYMVYQASSFYYAQKYSESVRVLNELIKDISFKNMMHVEVEVKLFLALCYSMQNKYDQAEILIKSISRKLNDREEEDYGNAQAFIRMLKMQMSLDVKEVEDKVMKQRDKFLLLNTGRTKLLSFLKMDDAFVTELSRSIKRSKS